MVIGLTGMSGAGKSTVCDVFRKKDIEIIDCDLLSRQVVKKGEPCLNELIKAFGKDIIAEGSLDRKKLGALVFSDRRSLKLLCDIIYPYISYLVLDGIRNSRRRFVAVDAPTLFESGIDFICDVVVSVVCDREVSIERIMRRDNIDRAHAESRLGSQHDRDFYINKSDISIINNESRTQLIEKAETAVNKIINGEL